VGEGEVAQTMYTHVNKCENHKILKKKSTFATKWLSHFAFPPAVNVVSHSHQYLVLFFSNFSHFSSYAVVYFQFPNNLCCQVSFRTLTCYLYIIPGKLTVLAFYLFLNMFVFLLQSSFVYLDTSPI
jgi:hypothetical protein